MVKTSGTNLWGMATACIVGPTHPHTIHQSAHSSHHQLLTALLPTNTHLPHLNLQQFTPGITPHLSILHEATRNHIQLALHAPSPTISLPSGVQFTLPAATAQQQISLPAPSQLSLAGAAPLNFPPPPTPQLALPAPPAAAQQISLPTPVSHSVPQAPPPSSGPRTSLPPTSAKPLTSTTSNSCSSTSSSSASSVAPSSSSASTPTASVRPAAHEPSELRTLYVGNLDSSASEELLMAVFSHIGPVRSCKLIHEAGNDPYCFVEFADRLSAENALHTMNKRLCLGKEMKINWATSPGTQGKVDTSTAVIGGDHRVHTNPHCLPPHTQVITSPHTQVISLPQHSQYHLTPSQDLTRVVAPRYRSQDLTEHYHIFVGDLSPEIETFSLREAFAPFGEISDCRVVRDPHTLKSKGYGFVSFIKKADAETAITNMNGQWIGNRNIRTNWATRKPPAPKTNDANQKPLTFDDVYNQSSPTNCTVYCGGITNGLSEELMQKTFSIYGSIQEIRVFKDKGYAFVRFSTKESATHAIVSVHNNEINGQPVKCSWGKESGDPNNTPVTTQVMTLTDVSECLSLQPLPGSQYPYNYPAGQMGYWYPQGYPTAAQVQGQQFLGMQGFTYGQYGYQQGMAGMAGVPTAAAWQGVPQPQIPTAAAAAAAAGQMAQLQQPPSMVGAYPVQQFQVQ